MDQIEARLYTLFADELNVTVPDSGTDLFATGLLDSLTLVELLLRLETVFHLKIPLADLEMDSFRTISNIAALISQQTAWATQLAAA